MGFSVTLLKKEFIEFSLEIDRNISLEIGTGFGQSDRVTTHINVPLTIEELHETIVEMQKIYDKLKTAWKCENCGVLNPREEAICENCAFLFDLTRANLI